MVWYSLQRRGGGCLRGLQNRRTVVGLPSGTGRKNGILLQNRPVAGHFSTSAPLPERNNTLKTQVVSEKENGMSFRTRRYTMTSAAFASDTAHSTSSFRNQGQASTWRARDSAKVTRCCFLSSVKVRPYAYLPHEAHQRLFVFLQRARTLCLGASRGQPNKFRWSANYAPVGDYVQSWHSI